MGPDAPILWYRPSIRRAALRIVLLAMGSILLGASILAWLRVAEVDFGSPWIAAYLVGIGCVVSGPLVLLRGHLRLLRKERVLTIAADGLRWQEGEAPPAVCHWPELGQVMIVEHQLVIETADAPWRLPLPFEGITPEALVRLLRELQQKALLGLPVRPRAIA